MHFHDLLNVDVQNYTEIIQPLRQGELASEYNSFIGNYSNQRLSVTNRIIPPYLSTNTHGVNCFDRLLNYIRSKPFTSILDLGCGAGQLLHRIGSQSVMGSLYGLSICTGEVAYARDVFKLKNIVPGDLRKCDEVFDGFKFDCVILHCVLQFINEIDRIKTAVKISKLLNVEGELLVIDYYNREESKMPNSDELNSIYNINVVGDLALTSMGSIISYKLYEALH